MLTLLWREADCSAKSTADRTLAALPALPPGLFVSSTSHRLDAVLALAGMRSTRPVTPGLQLAL